MRITNKKINFIFFTFLIILSIFTSCSQIPSDVKFSVIDEVRNDSFNKVNINVLINKKVDEQVLELIGNKLKEDLKIKEYSKIWMFYYLPDMKVGLGAWATTHFTPNLEVNIIGATKNQSEEIVKKAKEFEGAVIGKWKEEQFTSSIYIIYEKGNEFFIRTIYPNSQISDESIKMKKEANVIRFDYKTDSYNGEYFKMKNNELEFYNKDNKLFTKGKPID